MRFLVGIHGSVTLGCGMEMVFRGICGEQPLDIQLLTRIGSSSGTEMLLGMLIALHICGYAVNMREELP